MRYQSYVSCGSRMALRVPPRERRLSGNVPGRPALDGYLIDRYREYISGLLDVTDNIVIQPF